jgi:hypothetical protein
MRKFKHCKTGTEVKQIRENGDYECISTTYNIPKWSVENSQDWQEIKEEYPIFTSEDGVEVFEGNTIYYIYKDLHRN